MSTSASRSRRDVALARTVMVSRARLEARLRRQLRAFFRAQARRIAARLRELPLPSVPPPPRSLFTRAHEHEHEPAPGSVPVPASAIIPPGEDARLAAVIQPVARAMLIVADEQVAAMLGLPALVADDPRIRAWLAAAVYYPDGISVTTASAIARVIDEGMRRHYSPYEIAHGVPRDGYRGLIAELEGIGAARAETISRTVMAFASQQAAHDRYDEAGVTEVDIIDGPGCGWTRHEDPDKAHGSRRTLAAVRQYPISHPNCRRVSLPVLPARAGAGAGAGAGGRARRT